jgi:hypothetical protein
MVSKVLHLSKIIGQILFVLKQPPKNINSFKIKNKTKRILKEFKLYNPKQVQK